MQPVPNENNTCPARGLVELGTSAAASAREAALSILIGCGWAELSILNMSSDHLTDPRGRSCPQGRGWQECPGESIANPSLSNRGVLGGLGCENLDC